MCLQLQVYVCIHSMFTATNLFTSVSLCLQQFYGYSYKSVFQATDLCLQLVCVYSYNSMFTATILCLQLQIRVRSSEPALCSDDLWQLQSLACGCDKLNTPAPPALGCHDADIEVQSYQRFLLLGLGLLRI